MKNWLKTLLSGIAIGFGSAVPGVSGGTIAVIFGVYNKIIWAISNVFKHFKEAIKIVLPVLLGVVIGFVPTFFLMDKALNGFVFGVICIFAGFIIGSIPGIKDEVKDVKPTKKHFVALIICALIAIGLGVGSVFAKANFEQYFVQTPVWFYLVLIPVGFVASVALVVPGISGAMLLLLLGFYKPLMSFITGFIKSDWSGFGHFIGIIGCFAIGIIIGFFFVSKLMHYLLSKYHEVTFYSILGFVIGSVPALFYNYTINEYYMKWSIGAAGYTPMYIEIPIGIILLIGFTILSYLLVRYKRKIESKENEIVE